MKELSKGLHLLEATDTIPDKLTSAGLGRLKIGMKYKVLGYCKVDATQTTKGETIAEWHGFAVEDTEKKVMPISVSTALSMYFKDKKPNVFGSIFDNASDVKPGSEFRVIAKDDVLVDTFVAKGEELPEGKDKYSSRTVYNIAKKTAKLEGE